MKWNEPHTAHLKTRVTIGRASAYENIPRPSAPENRCKPVDIENIIKYHNGNLIISHRKHIDWYFLWHLPLWYFLCNLVY